MGESCSSSDVELLDISSSSASASPAPFPKPNHAPAKACSTNATVQNACLSVGMGTWLDESGDFETFDEAKFRRPKSSRNHTLSKQKNTKHAFRGKGTKHKNGAKSKVDTERPESLHRKRRNTEKTRCSIDSGYSSNLAATSGILSPSQTSNNERVLRVSPARAGNASKYQGLSEFRDESQSDDIVVINDSEDARSATGASSVDVLDCDGESEVFTFSPNQSHKKFYSTDTSSGPSQNCSVARSEKDVHDRTKCHSGIGNSSSQHISDGSPQSNASLAEERGIDFTSDSCLDGIMVGGWQPQAKEGCSPVPRQVNTDSAWYHTLASKILEEDQPLRTEAIPTSSSMLTKHCNDVLPCQTKPSRMGIINQQQDPHCHSDQSFVSVSSRAGPGDSVLLGIKSSAVQRGSDSSHKASNSRIATGKAADDCYLKEDGDVQILDNPNVCNDIKPSAQAYMSQGDFQSPQVGQSVHSELMDEDAADQFMELSSGDDENAYGECVVEMGDEWKDSDELAPRVSKADSQLAEEVVSSTQCRAGQSDSSVELLLSSPEQESNCKSVTGDDRMLSGGYDCDSHDSIEKRDGFSCKITPPKVSRKRKLEANQAPGSCSPRGRKRSKKAAAKPVNPSKLAFREVEGIQVPNPLILSTDEIKEICNTVGIGLKTNTKAAMAQALIDLYIKIVKAKEADSKVCSVSVPARHTEDEVESGVVHHHSSVSDKEAQKQLRKAKRDSKHNAIVDSCIEVIKCDRLYEQILLHRAVHIRDILDVVHSVGLRPQKKALMGELKKQGVNISQSKRWTASQGIFLEE